MAETKEHSDPKNYYQLSIPFESQQEADKATDGFYKELGELRKKYNLREIMVVIMDSTKTQDGDVSEFMTIQNYGDSLHRLPMAAYAYGVMNEEHKNRINKLASLK